MNLKYVLCWVIPVNSYDIPMYVQLVVPVDLNGSAMKIFRVCLVKILLKIIKTISFNIYFKKGQYKIIQDY